MTTYAEIKRSVLELINQHSIAGTAVPPAYNNQSDYIHRIPNLINQGLMDIRTAWNPKRLAVYLSREEGEYLHPGSRWMRWPLPPLCRRIISGGVMMLGSAAYNDAPVPFSDFRILDGGTTIALPAGEARCAGHDFIAEYEAYPEQLPVDPEDPSVPADSYALAEDPDVVQTACLYAAAMLMMMEDSFTYAALRNEYDRRVRAMQPPLTAQYTDVDAD